VQVNKLVQSAEFLTGPEVRLASFSRARNSATDSIGTRYELMTYFGIGSIGPFSPGDDPAVFAVPPAPTGGAAASAFAGPSVFADATAGLRTVCCASVVLLIITAATKLDVERSTARRHCLLLKFISSPPCLPPAPGANVRGAAHRRKNRRPQSA